MEMSAEHKAALAAGRKQAHAITAYLEALSKRRPGRPVTSETLQSRLGVIDRQLSTASSPLQKVELVQRRIDTKKALASTQAVDMESLEQSFVESVGAYSARKGISYAAWREIGVSASVLKLAGITRGD